MAAKITNEGDVSEGQVLDESNKMWSKVRESKKSRNPEDEDALYQRLWKEHPQFCQAYPLVVGEMVQGRFHYKAFRTYLKYLSKGAWAKSKDDWLRSQAHYNCILYKHIVPHYNIKDANAAEEHAYQALKREDASWEENAAEVQREMEEEKRRIADLKRDELKEYLTRLKGDLPAAMADGASAGAAAITDTGATADTAEAAKNNAGGNAE